MGEHWQGARRDGPGRGSVRAGAAAALPPPVLPQDKGILDQGHELHRQEHHGSNEDYDMGYRSMDELRRWQERDPLIQDQDRVARFSTQIKDEIEKQLLACVSKR